MWESWLRIMGITKFIKVNENLKKNMLQCHENVTIYIKQS